MKRAFSFGDRSLEAAIRRVNEIRSVAVIGAGTMGQGIAIDLLRKTDYEVILLDIQAEALDRAGEKLSSLWHRQVKAGQTVTITEYGKPVATISPVAQSLEEKLKAMIEAGLLQWSGKKLGLTPRVAVNRGERTVADLLIEDRE